MTINAQGSANSEDVDGNKGLDLRGGRSQVDIPHPERYGHRDASVLTGRIAALAFEVSEGGLFRSFDQSGPGKCRLHAHVMSGEIFFAEATKNWTFCADRFLILDGICLGMRLSLFQSSFLVESKIRHE